MKLFAVESILAIHEVEDNKIRFVVGDDVIGPHIAVLCNGCGEEHSRLVFTREEISRLKLWVSQLEN